jgi:hypothetical protein
MRKQEVMMPVEDLSAFWNQYTVPPPELCLGSLAPT